MKVTAIIQARLGSSRLPGKVLMKIMGKTILEYGLERIQKAKSIKDIIVATTEKKEDYDIVKLVKKLGIKLYRGSEGDVLDRYYQAAKKYKAKHIARLTSDCPIVDHQVIDKVVQKYFSSKADYCSNTIKETYPDGQDVEVFSFFALREAWQKSKLLSEREHVTPYMKKNSTRFKLVNVENPKNLSHFRWTIDEVKDFELIKEIIESLYSKKKDFQIKDVIEFLNQKPHLTNLNQGIKRNEGYLKSLQNDRSFS